MKNFFVYSFEILKLFYLPMFKGTFIGGMPVLAFHALTLFWLARTPIFEKFDSSYDKVTLGSAQLENLHTNRCGLFGVACCILFLKLGASEMVPGLPEVDEKLTAEKLVRGHLKNLQKKYAKSGKKKLASETGNTFDLELEEQNDNLNEEYYEPEHHPFTELSQLCQIKARGFLLVLLLSVVPMIYFMTQRRWVQVGQRIYLYLFAFEALTGIILRKAAGVLLGEALLVAPLIATFEITLSYVFLKEETYGFFEICLIRSAVYLGVLTACFFVWKILMIAENCRKGGLAPEKYSAYFYYLLVREQLRRLKAFLGLKSVKKRPKEKHEKFGFSQMRKSEIPRETLLTLILFFAAKGCASLLRFCTAFFNIFYTDPQYNGLPSEFMPQLLINNLVFAILTIIFDISTFYLLEGWLDFEIVNLLNFYKFRFERRRSNWLLERMTLDESIKPGYRSLDYLGFSDQFFVILAAMATNLAVLAYLIYIIIERSYNVFNDASTFLIILLAVTYSLLVSLLFRTGFDLLGIWESSPQPPGDKYETGLKLENYTISEFNVLSEPFIVEDFIKHQRDWLSQNLERILRPEDFLKNEGYLVDLHLKITSNIKSLEIASLRGEIIDRYRYVAALNSQRHLDSVVRTTPERFYNLSTIMHYWLSLGKEAIYYRRQVEGIGERFKKRLCEDCHTDEALIISERNSLYKILSFYRVRLKGSLSRRAEWIDFYTKHQVFITLCENCEKIRRIKRFKRNQLHLETNYGNIRHQSDFSEKILKDLIRIDLKQGTKVLLYQWWLAARSRLLGRGRTGTGSVHDQIMKILDEYESNC